MRSIFNRFRAIAVPGRLPTISPERAEEIAAMPPFKSPVRGCDPVNHPAHYTSHPSGVECIQVAQHFPFNLGNAIKYIWRAGGKGDAIEDLKKARRYLDYEIERLGK